MKKLSDPPLSKREERAVERLQARLLREYRALGDKDLAAEISADTAKGKGGPGELPALQ